MIILYKIYKNKSIIFYKFMLDSVLIIRYLNLMIINMILKSKQCILQKEETLIIIHLIYNLVEINPMDTAIKS